MVKITFENNVTKANADTFNTMQDNIESDLGLLTNLTTTDKTNLVSAINEVNAKPTGSSITGSITIYAGSTAPTGYLLCDGSAVSRSTYSDLFDIIGTTYGTGDGSTTFNLPNLKGKVVVGQDSNDTDFDTLGETGGEKTHTLITEEIPSHSHDGLKNIQYVYTGSGTNGAGVALNTGTNDARITTYNAGGGQAHNNLQPYIVLNYIIKY